MRFRDPYRLDSASSRARRARSTGDIEDTSPHRLPGRRGTTSGARQMVAPTKGPQSDGARAAVNASTA